MKLYIIIKNRKDLPESMLLIETMWRNDIDYSKTSDELEFKNATFFGLKWNKTFDDERWRGNKYFSIFIDFDLPECLDNYKEPITIETEDDIPTVDKRAFYKAALLIAETCEGKISFDTQEWLTKDEFYNKYKQYIDISFEEAVEISIEECKPYTKSE